MADTTIDRILRLRRLGMNNNTIGSILGITGAQVSNMLKDPTIADPVLGAQTSRSAYMGDITVVNPADPDVEVNVGAALTVAPGHPFLADIGVFASIDPTIPSHGAIADNGVVAVRLKALMGGVEVPDFEDWLSLDSDEARYWAKSAQVMTDKTCVLQVVARFLEGTLPTFTATSLGPDFKLTARHFNADNTDFVDKITGLLHHGDSPATVAAALNAVDDIPGVFSVVAGGANEYVITAPHKYVQMDVVGADGQYNVLVGGVIPGDNDVPDAPQSVTLQDVSIFFGSA